jgi:acyl-CoA synthetase (AMP-forming)/AMP-acid ligase II
LFDRYWQDEEQTKQATVIDETDGKVWMRTGDEGIMDEEGYLQGSPARLLLGAFTDNTGGVVVGRIKVR